MYRNYGLVLAACCLLIVVGCRPDLTAGVDVAHATLVSYDQFKEATKDETVFWHVGGDAEFQYFRTKNGFYRMRTSTEYLSEESIRSTIRTFENVFKIGETGIAVMIRESGKIGAPAPGVDTNIPYPPRD